MSHRCGQLSLRGGGQEPRMSPELMVYDKLSRGNFLEDRRGREGPASLHRLPLCFRRTRSRSNRTAISLGYLSVFLRGTVSGYVP